MASHIGDGFERVGDWGGDAVAYGGPGGGGSNGVAQKEDGGRVVLDSACWCGCRYCYVVAMDGVMGSPKRGYIHDPRVYDGWLWRTSFLIQRHMGGGLRRPDGKEGACSGGVPFSWIIRRAFLFFCETFHKPFCVKTKRGSYLETRSQVHAKASLPTGYTHPHFMKALIWAPSPSRIVVHRLIANSCSLATRCISRTWSSNWAAASFVDNENDAESRPTENG